MFTIRYKTTRFKVSGKKPEKCEVCGLKPKRLQGHHTIYRYPVQRVRENPELAKENVVWVCYHCHRVANCIRVMLENPDKSKKLLRCYK